MQLKWASDNNASVVDVEDVLEHTRLGLLPFQEVIAIADAVSAILLLCLAA